ncbi:lytic transglycosylase domain-containing protein [Sporolactobacillus sp. THM7-4]|nr:lytic transglycosylase domain-containing protein [Sporolactobacillus sp. THM7-4]
MLSSDNLFGTESDNQAADSETDPFPASGADDLLWQQLGAIAPTISDRTPGQTAVRGIPSGVPSDRQKPSGVHADQTNTSYKGLVSQIARKYSVDPALVASVIAAESGGNPDATSSSGAKGLMQLMPETAAALGVTDPYDPARNIEGGTKYLRSMLDRFGGNTSLALAAYNAGPQNVIKYGGVPPFSETRTYIKRVLGAAGHTSV